MRLEIKADLSIYKIEDGGPKGTYQGDLRIPMYIDRDYHDCIVKFDSPINPGESRNNLLITFLCSDLVEPKIFVGSEFNLWDNQRFVAKGKVTEKSVAFEYDSDEIKFSFTCNAAPVQAEGYIDRLRFYFHSRHECWSFALAGHSDIEPVDINKSSRNQFFVEQNYGESKSESASYMSKEQAKEIILLCADLYRKSRVQ